MLLFTYGTLMRGLRNHHYVENSDFVAHAISIEKFDIIMRATEDYPDGYPVAFLASSGGGNLGGEIYEVDDETLQRIDILEDYPHEYDRILMQFECDDGAVRDAFVYIGKEDYPHDDL